MSKQAAKTMPINLLIEGRPCLVVGGGAVATRKVGHLLASGADIKVVSPCFTETLIELGDLDHLVLISRPWQASDVDGQTLVFAATDDSDVNRQVLEACRQQGILCCLVDHQWPEGDFITPAIVRQGSITASVSLGGSSPSQVRKLRSDLELLLRRD